MKEYKVPIQSLIDHIKTAIDVDPWAKEMAEELLKEQEAEIEQLNRFVNGFSRDAMPVVRCKDCKNWIPGYITDQDDFIPPKCGKYQQMVGHSADDFCSLAEKQEGR